MGTNGKSQNLDVSHPVAESKRFYISEVSNGTVDDVQFWCGYYDNSVCGLQPKTPKPNYLMLH